jgi:DNA repair photolyase
MNMKTNPQMHPLVSHSHPHSSAPRPKHGAQECAAKTVNIVNGCSHNCLYCDARSIALRFHRIASPKQWPNEKLKPMLPEIRKYDGRVMFPSTHDITPPTLDLSVAVLRGLLKKENEVLVVSKPHFECVKRLCREFEDFKKQLLFRFTIGSIRDENTYFWEPGAPPASERLRCLRYAYRHGFRTSVSMEPMLAGIIDATQTFFRLTPYVTDKIWVGKMNQIARCIDQRNEIVRRACSWIQAVQSDDRILKLVDGLKHHPKVEWKDSIRKVIEAHASASRSNGGPSNNHA